MDKNFTDKTNFKNSNSKISKTIINGFKNGLNITWILAKTIIPVYFFVNFLSYIGVLEWISNVFIPVMNIFGLPGKAAIVIVLGNVLNLYAAIGAIASISLSVKQITIIAIMLSFSHSLFVETAVAKRAGISGLLIVFIRISLAIISGIVFNLVL